MNWSRDPFETWCVLRVCCCVGAIVVPAMRPPTNANLRISASFLERWALQLYALTAKNFRLQRRLRKLTACEFIAPLCFIILCVVLTVVLSYQYSRVDESRTLARFADGRDSHLTCRVFDSHYGKYGNGMPIPRAWCVPLCFAPTSNSVLDVMRELAGRNGLSAPRLWSGNLTAEAELPAACVQTPSAAAGTSDGGTTDGDANGESEEGGAMDSRCVLGFATLVEMRTWLLHHRGRAAVAVAFGGSPGSAATYNSPGPWSNASIDPLADSELTTLTYELWYNESSTRWYSQAGLDRLKDGLVSAGLDGGARTLRPSCARLAADPPTSRHGRPHEAPRALCRFCTPAHWTRRP